MKTLKELNSKWYWRLVKIIFFLVVFVTMASCIFVYEEMKTYNPEIFKIYDEKEKGAYERLIELRTKYPNKIVSQEEMKTHHTLASELSSLFRMGKEVEGQELNNKIGKYDKEKCTNIFGEYIRELNQKGKVDTFKIDTSICGVNSMSEFDKFIEKGRKYFDPKTDNDEKGNVYQEITGKYIYRDYLGFWGVVKTIFAIIGLWIIVVITALIIKCCTYYIIFGKISPPK